MVVTAKKHETRINVFNVQKYNLYDGPGIRTIVFSRVVPCVVGGVPIQKAWSLAPT
ncbi:glycyl-radical activating family protein [Streptococcus dysgalactiae subsp. equisimilis 167]|nr:glycyl-radical activating family protein [Streptococcus dysgalactiae subsp. equisimilis 167]